METITFTELELTVEYDYQRAERMTHSHPGCPEAIEITEIKILDCPICQQLFENIIHVYGKKIEAAIWEEIREEQEERKIMQAEYRQDAREELNYNFQTAEGKII